MIRCNAKNLCALALIFVFVINPAAAATCDPGALDLDLVSASGTGATTHPIAKCFNSVTVNVLADCTLTLTASGDNSFVPAFWSAAPTYSQVKACPTGVSMAFTDATVATSNTGMASLFATSIYAEGMTASVDVSSGVVTVTSTYLTNTATLKFRSSGQSGSTAGFFGTVGAPTCEDLTECSATAITCGAGRYPILISGRITYLCALCSSGSYAAALSTSCTKSASGTALPAVGATTDTSTACGAGTFATLGSSDCRPCATGMYQNATSQSSCKSCPTSWSSHTYGATGCVKCTYGRPAVCTSDCSDITAGSGASFTATMSGNTLATASGWDSGYTYPALLNPCSPSSTLVSFTVDATCAMEIRALAVSTVTDGLMCSDPTNTASSVTAYYTDTTTIMNRPSTLVDKSNIVKIVNKDTTSVTMSVIAATSYPIAPTVTISGDLTVNGGDIVGVDGGATCPAGTYISGSANTLSCTPCQPGYYCASGATASTTTCDAGKYSTLGQATCTSCPANTYAPAAGSGECLVCAAPDVVSTDSTSCGSTDCGTGKEFNPATNVCDCTAGYRASGSGNCTICPANTYSSGGPTSVIVASCSPCPSGQVSTAGSDTCSLCPSGQIKIGEVCSRCPAGQQPDGSSCVSCPDGYYNPNNGGTALFDACQRCDNGKYTDAEKTTCTACIPGTYARWSSLTVRVPSNYTICQECPDGGYSASGAERCTACSGGAQASPGKDSCVKCIAGTFRVPYSAGGCVACPAGTASRDGSDTCTSCRPGQFSVEGSGTCSSCAENTYSTDPGSTTCVACQAGSTTLGETGATECTGCTAGTYYNATTKACIDCEAGYYQDRDGQKTCKKCPIGKFSDTAGATTCDSCPAGKYSSSSGSSTCRICPGGTFSAGGKGSCSICDRGKYSLPGSTACTRCAAGYYASKLGSRTCTACPTGSKCPGVGNTGPILCTAGYFQSKPAQTTCRVCPKKSFSAKAGATRCAVCSDAITVGTTSCPAPSPSRRRILLTRLDFLSFQ